VVRLHIDYETSRTNEKRQQAILDAQKRRLYRRAHGLENLDAEEDQGIDVRGLVDWDDGLTNKERERGGRQTVLSLGEMMRLGLQPGEDMQAFTDKLIKQDGGRRWRMIKERGVEFVVEKEEREAKMRMEGDLKAQMGEFGDGKEEVVDGVDVVQEQQPVQRERRKRKLWFGIW
jgi:hypothetical protein